MYVLGNQASIRCFASLHEALTVKNYKEKFSLLIEAERKGRLGQLIQRLVFKINI